MVLLLVFGALFASADALFASWVDSITPDITWNDLPARVVLALFIAAGTLAAAYVSMAPPAVERLQLPMRPSRRQFEWLAPVTVVNAVFLLFLVAQATAMFGGHDYLQRTTGLTYADYVHEGFGQLTVATILTLTVVAWAARKATPGRARDLALGALCVMTIVVVVSALYRMHLYEEAYGFTRLRLLVSVFEGWLGVVVLLVMAAGVVEGARWLVPMAVRLGAVGLLGLALVNPDLYIAEHNIARADCRHRDRLRLPGRPVRGRLPRDLEAARGPVRLRHRDRGAVAAHGRRLAGVEPRPRPRRATSWPSGRSATSAPAGSVCLRRDPESMRLADARGAGLAAGRSGSRRAGRRGRRRWRRTRRSRAARPGSGGRSRPRAGTPRPEAPSRPTPPAPPAGSCAAGRTPRRCR